VEFSVGADSMVPDIGFLFNYLGIPGGQPKACKRANEARFSLASFAPLWTSSDSNKLNKINTLSAIVLD
jgi:hypothetical protein